MTMRTKEEMREYQRKRRTAMSSQIRDDIDKAREANRIKRAQRNRDQSENFKTVGGRNSYFACTKTDKFKFGKFFNESGERKINGVKFYGFCL